MSNSRARGLVLAGLVERNGAVAARPDERIAEGDRILLRHDPGTAYTTPRRSPRTGGYRVVHEEAGFLVSLERTALGVTRVLVRGVSGKELETTRTRLVGLGYDGHLVRPEQPEGADREGR